MAQNIFEKSPQNDTSIEKIEGGFQFFDSAVDSLSNGADWVQDYLGLSDEFMGGVGAAMVGLLALAGFYSMIVVFALL